MRNVLISVIVGLAASAALRRDREFGWNLAENPKRMRIQTLDSLNGSIARSRHSVQPD